MEATLDLAVGRRDLWREVGPGALGKEGEGGAGRRVLVNVHTDEVRKSCEVFCPDRLPKYHRKLLVGALEANLPLSLERLRDSVSVLNYFFITVVEI